METAAISIDDHKRSVLKEIVKNRVISQDSYDFFSTSTTKQSKGTGVKYKTDVPPWRHNQSLSSWKKRSRAGTHEDQGEPQDLEESISQVSSLPRRLRHPLASTQPSTDTPKEIYSGKLYKTSRDKITSNLTRGQHEHRQHRRFQLTEHSLEYSQLLQRVSTKCYVM